MNIHVSGQHVSVGSSLIDYVKERANLTISKYFNNSPACNVKFSKEAHKFVCSLVVNDGMGRGVTLKSRSSSDEVYNSFDKALAKTEKQLRKYKSKLNNYGDKIKISEVFSNATKYVISANNNQSEEEENTIDENNPLIIAEKPVDILKLSVGDAVMKMDFENLPALMFENTKTGRINVVYYRKDGNISWVDSDRQNQ